MTKSFKDIDIVESTAQNIFANINSIENKVSATGKGGSQFVSIVSERLGRGASGGGSEAIEGHEKSFTHYWTEIRLEQSRETILIAELPLVPAI